MVYALLLSCAAPPAGDALPASAKSPPVRPFSLGLDLPAVPGAYLDRDDDHDGWSEREGDCDDTTGAVSPRMWEDCNRIDDDCDGEVDEGYDPEVCVRTFAERWFVLDGPGLVSGQYRIQFEDVGGSELCALVLPLRVTGDGLGGCPDCVWSFEGVSTSAEVAGDHCDLVDINWPVWDGLLAEGREGRPYSYGYALSAYEYWLWYDDRWVNRTSGESVLLNSGLGWGVMWTNFDPSGLHQVYGDGTGTEVTVRERWVPYWLPYGYTWTPE